MTKRRRPRGKGPRRPVVNAADGGATHQLSTRDRAAVGAAVAELLRHPRPAPTDAERIELARQRRLLATTIRKGERPRVAEWWTMDLLGAVASVEAPAKGDERAQIAVAIEKGGDALRRVQERRSAEDQLATLRELKKRAEAETDAASKVQQAVELLALARPAADRDDLVAALPALVRPQLTATEELVLRLAGSVSQKALDRAWGSNAAWRAALCRAKKAIKILGRLR